MTTSLWVTVFASCLLNVLLLPTIQSEELVAKEWWETALVYQIWPRGFQDSDGDGEGDLRGIISRLDYIEDLGTDAIWLNPIYSSPLVDSGYDISNYTDVDPLFGTLDDFDELIENAHSRGLKVLLDFVPNHSSDEHPWFQLSSGNVDPYTNYYVWSDGSVDDDGNNLPPNNWVSTYDNQEGSAWTWNDDRQQWYYHKFHEVQPDLNLRNEDVVKELLDVFEFWLKRGVDGFRLNAVPYFFENEQLENEPFAGSGNHTFGLPESTGLLYRFREYINEWVTNNNVTSKLLIVESNDSDENLIAYYGNETHTGIPPFNFRFITHINSHSNAEHMKNTLEDWLGKLPTDSSTNWVLSNHDNSRAATRIGLNLIDGLHMLSLLLPGQAYTYYGEEIAMLDRTMHWNETIDPMGCRKTNETYNKYSRDPARTPMQWNANVSAGFSTNNSTYLPVHSNYIERNVERQQKEEESNLNTYKQLAALRKNPVFTHGDYDFATLNNDHVFVLKRSLESHSTYIVLINVGLRKEKVNLTEIYPNLENPIEILVASSNTMQPERNITTDGIILTANAALVLKGHEIEIPTEQPSTSTEAENITISSTTPEVIITTESVNSSIRNRALTLNIVVSVTFTLMTFVMFGRSF